MADTNSPAPPAAAHEPLEADDTSNFETDSALGDNDDTSERTSIFSEIMKYREENGRRFHGYKDGSYLLPNDETEQNRLDLSHHVFSMVYKGKLGRAPIDKPARVLDVGTGTGIWVMDFGDAHKESHIIGIDLSPIQPTWVTPNVEFLVDDAEDEWIGQKYDYIHIRMLAGAIKDWPGLLRKAYNHLNPGGWLECAEFEVWIKSYNNTLHNAPDIQKWQDGLHEAADKFGRTMDVAPNLDKWLKETGLEDVVEEKTIVPGSPWAKDKELKTIGAYQLLNMLDAASSYGQAHFTRVLGWSPEEYAVLNAKVRTQLKDRSVQHYAEL
ncbi:TAM domain methyltransferase [Stipitochalara longipes BDJ]|nr:TAM domain methyltransferase [Stipitochalara longipes BDJ]